MPDLSEVPWANDVGAFCSQPLKIVKEQRPDRRCPSVVAPCEATLNWTPDRSEVVVSWLDMPMVVYGGSEDAVMRRMARIDFGAQRRIRVVDSFIGVDRGDVGELHTIVRGYDGVDRYSRSEHHEDGNDQNYDAYEPRPSLSSAPTGGVTIELLARATGENHNPYAYPRETPLSVFCHIEVRLFFE